MSKYKSVPEQILALKRSKQKIVEEMKSLAGLRTKSEGDDDNKDGDDRWSDDKEECWKQMMDKIDEHDDKITRLESIASLEKSDEVEPEDNAEMSYDPEFRGEPRLKKSAGIGHNSRHYAEAVRSPVNDEPGFKMVRYIMGLHQMKHYGREAALNFVEQRFNDHRVTRALASLTQGAGGAMVPADFYQEIIELLRSPTVVRGSGPLIIGGPNGNMTMARLAGGATAGYGVELASTAVSQETFDNLQFSAKKLTALVPVSNSLIRRAAFGVEQIIREDLILTVARREDLAFLTGAGNANDPVGFQNLVLSANTLSFSALPQTGGYPIALAYLLQALTVLEQGASRMIRPVWIGSPLQKFFLAGLTDSVGDAPFKDTLMTANPTLLGYPFKTTLQLGTSGSIGQSGIMFLVDMADVVIMDSYTPEVDVSVDGTWVTGGTTYSAFQNDSSLLRIILEHDFAIRHLQSLCMMNTTGWTPGFYANSTSTQFANTVAAAYTTQAINNTASSAPSANPTTTSGA